jgi:hypothetical protein
VRWEFGCVPLAFAALTRIAEAQSAPPTPEDVVREFFKAEEEGRWIDAAHSLDLTRFEPIRRSAVQALKSVTSRPKTTAQDIMRWEPDMPLAAAEYQAKRSNESSQSFDFLSREFARVPSIDSLVAMPIDQAAARWLEARGSKWQNEVAFKELRRRPKSNCPEMPDSIVRATRAEFKLPVTTIMGATEASDSVRYVVVGLTTFGGDAPNSVRAPYPEMSPKAIIMRKLDGNWRISPAPDLPSSDASGGLSGPLSISCRKEQSPKPGARTK